jgi:hypothetical protein
VAGGFGGEIAHSVQIAAVGTAEFHIEPDRATLGSPPYCHFSRKRSSLAMP